MLGSSHFEDIKGTICHFLQVFTLTISLLNHPQLLELMTANSASVRNISGDNFLPRHFFPSAPDRFQLSTAAVCVHVLYVHVFVRACFVRACFVRACFCTCMFCTCMFLYVHVLYVHVFVRACFVRVCFVRACFVRACFVRACFVRACFVRACFVRACFKRTRYDVNVSKI